MFRNLLGTWEFNEDQVVTYVRRTERNPTYASYNSLIDEELLQEVHDQSGCSYCGVRNCSVPVHQAARNSKDQLLDREVNWRQKTVSGEVCGDIIHSIADCAMFGDKYVYHNDIPVWAAVHNVHCIQADKDRLKQVRRDQMELEVVKEQERLQRLKRKVVTTEGIVFLPLNNPVELEINREEKKVEILQNRDKM